MGKRMLVSLDTELESALSTVKRLEGTPEAEQIRRALREWFSARGVLSSERQPNPTKAGRKERVLADHTRVGKRFIPPFLRMGMGRMDEISWSREIIPEFLWLGLLNQAFGEIRGAELGLAIAKASAQTSKRSRKRVWFGPLSAFGSLGRAAQADVIESLNVGGTLDAVRSALLPIVSLYPECPLGFIGQGAQQDSRDELKAIVRNQMSSMLDRSSRQATMVQANAIYIAFATDTLKVFKGSSLAKFPAIEQYPATEESKIVASAVRAGVNGMFGPVDRVRSRAWISSFWKRGFEIDGCTFEE